MSILIVVDNPKDWSLHIEGVEVVPARKYLVDPVYSDRQHAKVFNLCKSYAYQSLGYYVSLLAAARGHKPLPAISTIQDLKLSELIRIAGEETDDLIQSALSPLKSTTFTLSIYFGRNLAERYERLALALFNQFPAPFLRAEFRYDEPDSKWELTRLRPIAASDIPEDHKSFVIQTAKQYFSRPQRRARRAEARYDLAILRDIDEKTPPSDEKALKKFIRAAESMGIDADLIDRDEYGRLAEYDALFIRQTTAVDHHTFRFAQRAEAEGLVVIDDPESIVRCANKVYLAELLAHNRIPHPRTVILHRDNTDTAAAALGFPCVLKKPDSSFSMGVIKAADQAEFEAVCARLFPDSELLIAQEFTPTAFDWRVGIIDGEPLYACKYFMADDHWQIIDNSVKGRGRSGRTETWPVNAAPPEVVKAALRTANLIGDGLYGVDVKEIKGRPVVMEINDNPNIDSGCEDAVLNDELYARIMRSFLKRLESRGR